MEKQLSEEQKLTYGLYFKSYYDYLSHIWNFNAPADVEFDGKIIAQFMNAVLDSSPKRVYKVEPLRYKFYFILFKMCGFSALDDWLTEKFVSMPKAQISPPTPITQL